MTPFGLRIVRSLLASSDPARASRFLAGPSFDLSPVSPVVGRTMRQMVEMVQLGGDDPLLEHGGLLFSPDTSAWVEARDGSARLGALVIAVEDELGFTGFNEKYEQVNGFLRLNPDGEHFSVHYDVRSSAQGKEAMDRTTLIGLWVAAGLLMINAPRGVVRTATHAHRGLAQEAKRKLGIGELQPMHTITLSTIPEVVGNGAGVGGSPKMFHFCRSHIRRLTSGATTRVRAHWRGDPSLGVGVADYRVMSA